MNFELKNLKAYIVVTLSCLYAMYTGSIFLENLLGNLPVAIFSSLTMGLLGHLYLMEACKSLKQRKFSSNVLVAVLLCGIVIFFDLKGVQDKSIADNLSPTITRHQVEKGLLDQRIEATSKIIEESSTHTVKGKTNWALYNTYNKSSLQLESLMNSLQQLKETQKKELLLEAEKADEHTGYMSGISIVLVLLSILVSFSLEENKQQELNTVVPTESSKTLISATKNETAAPTDVVNNSYQKPSVDDILKSIMGNTTKDNVNNFHYLQDYNTKERMRIAIAYIKTSGVTKHELLSKKFLLNFKQISIVKNSALEKGGQKIKNDGNRKLVGFELAKEVSS